MTLTQQPTQIPVTFLDEDSSEAAECSEAISTARSIQPVWARLPLTDKLYLVRKLRHLVAEHAEELASAAVRAWSRPVSEVLSSEVVPLAEAYRFLEQSAGEILSPVCLNRWKNPLWLWGTRSELHREPYGVVLIIGPGNYPLFLPGVQMLQALVAGNAVLVKPGQEGTAAIRVLCRLMAKAGFPKDLVTILPESDAAARAAIASRPDKVVFTGSAATGRLILAQLAQQLTPVTLELSGSDAVIIRADADVDLAVRALVFGLRLNRGATCISPKRVFVAIHLAPLLETRLAAALTESAAKLPISSAAETGCATGFAGERLRCLVDEALSMGAHLVAGDLDSQIAADEPIVLAGVPAEAEILQQDIFGPFLSIVPVKNDRQAIQMANNSPFGLGACIFSRDETAARILAGELNAGVVTINDLIIPTADARVPFGGRGSSGFGITRGAEGLLELSRPKVVTLTKGSYRPALEPSEPWHQQLFQAYVRAAHGAGITNRMAAVADMIRAVVGRGKTFPKETM